MKEIIIALIDEQGVLSPSFQSYFETSSIIELAFTCQYAIFFETITKKKEYPTIVFFNINDFLGKNIFKEIAFLKNLNPKMKIVLLGKALRSDLLLKSLEIGASGYISSNATMEAIEQYVILLQSNAVMLTNSIQNTIKQPLNAKESEVENQYNFSKKEIEVVSLLSMGYSYQQIADTLFISINTCRYYIKTIYKKTGTKKRSSFLVSTQKQ